MRMSQGIDPDDARAGCSSVDTTGWTFTADDAEGARAAIVGLLDTHAAPLPSLIRLLDNAVAQFSGRRALSHAEFDRVMATQLGYCGNGRVLRQIRAVIDDDAAGAVHVDDVRDWLSGELRTKPERMADVRTLTLHAAATASAASSAARLPAAIGVGNGWSGGGGGGGGFEAWDEARLHAELRAMCDGARIKMSDLLDSISCSVGADGSISRRELLRWFRRLTGDDSTLWPRSVRPALPPAGLDADQTLR